jgi:hypothetical protein
MLDLLWKDPYSRVLAQWRILGHYGLSTTAMCRLVGQSKRRKATKKRILSYKNLYSVYCSQTRLQVWFPRTWKGRQGNLCPVDHLGRGYHDPWAARRSKTAWVLECTFPEPFELTEAKVRIFKTDGPGKRISLEAWKRMKHVVTLGEV